MTFHDRANIVVRDWTFSIKTRLEEQEVIALRKRVEEMLEEQHFATAAQIASAAANDFKKP